ARRAYQRPRRGDAARAGGGAAGLPRLRGGDLARPLVPRPHRHPHPRLRGQLAGGVLRGQLPGVRGGLRAPARRGDPPRAHQVQEADAMSSAGAWAPLRHRQFALLWSAGLVANVGNWMYDLAARWLMTEFDPSASMVALVQVASALPVF